MKAVFEMSLTVEEQYVALSNMPVRKEEKVGVKKKLCFEPSPRMSSYLVCFVVGEYECVEGKTSSGMTMRVWGRKGEAQKGEFALRIGVKTMEFYEQFFGIPYPLPKMDMVGLMNMGGAMENWGLVTYRDNLLLCDEKTASFRQRLTILTIATHELGHQWFGNLVTMDWWKELWLNEGFATWVETHCAHEIMPEYQPWTDFCRSTLTDGLDSDALLSSHPIEVEVFKSRDVDEVFDNISYNKGAGVIRMLASILGINAFSKGLHHYLSRFAYRNATTLDLWQALSESTGKDVKAIMHPWTSNMGYPVIYIDCDHHSATNGGSSLKFTQHRFLSSGKPAEENDKVLWPIHLTYRTKPAGTDKNAPQSDIQMISFTGREHHVPFNTKDLKWFKANVDQHGFMRVIYSPSLFEKLLHGLEDGDFDAIDRWTLVSDAFATFLAGLTPANDLFKLLSKLKTETDNTVLGEISDKFGELEIVFGDQFAEQLKKFKRDLFSAPFARLSVTPKDGESDQVAASRSIVLQEMASVGNEEVIAECRRLFALMESGDFSTVQANLWALVLGTVVHHGTKEDIEKVKTLAMTLKDSMSRITTLSALGKISDAHLLEDTLKWALISPALPAAVGPRMAFGASVHKVGRDMNWKVLEENVEAITERHHQGPFIFSMIIEHSTVFANDEMANRVEQFFKKLKIQGVDRTVDQAVDKIRSRAAIHKRSASTLATWFSSNGY